MQFPEGITDKVIPVVVGRRQMYLGMELGNQLGNMLGPP